MVSVCLQRTHEEYVELLCAKNIIDIIHPHYHLRGAVFWSFSLFRQRSWDSTGLIISSRCHIELVTDLGPKFTRWVCESSKALCSFPTTLDSLNKWKVLMTPSKVSSLGRPGLGEEKKETGDQGKHWGGDIEMGLQGQVKFWCGEMVGGIMWNRKTVAPWTSQKVVVWRPDDQGLTWCRGNEAEGWGTSSRKGVSDVESTLPWWPTRDWVRYYLEGGRTVDIKLRLAMCLDF